MMAIYAFRKNFEKVVENKGPKQKMKKKQQHM